jgi:hypothetical protein
MSRRAKVKKEAPPPGLFDSSQGKPESADLWDHSTKSAESLKIRCRRSSSGLNLGRQAKTGKVGQPSSIAEKASGVLQKRS